MVVAQAGGGGRDSRQEGYGLRAGECRRTATWAALTWLPKRSGCAPLLATGRATAVYVAAVGAAAAVLPQSIM